MGRWEGGGWREWKGSAGVMRQGEGGMPCFPEGPWKKKHQESVSALENQSWETCHIITNTGRQRKCLIGLNIVLEVFNELFNHCFFNFYLFFIIINFVLFLFIFLFINCLTE